MKTYKPKYKQGSFVLVGEQLEDGKLRFRFLNTWFRLPETSFKKVYVETKASTLN